MRVLELPSYSEQLELLPLRWSEPVALGRLEKPEPEHFREPKPRKNRVLTNRLASLPRRRDDVRGYMREYMRRRRAAQREAIA